MCINICETDVKHNSSEVKIKDLLIFTISISVTLAQHYVSNLLLLYLSFRMCTNDLYSCYLLISDPARVRVQEEGDRFIQVDLMSVNLLLHQSPEVDNTCFNFRSVSVSVRFFFSSTFSLSRAVWVQRAKLCDSWNENKKHTEMAPRRRVQEPFMHLTAQDSISLLCGERQKEKKRFSFHHFSA